MGYSNGLQLGSWATATSPFTSIVSNVNKKLIFLTFCGNSVRSSAKPAINARNGWTRDFST